MGEIITLAERRADKAGKAKADCPELFKPRPYAQDDFKNLQGGLTALADMVRSGLLSDPHAISAILNSYGDHARIAEMTAGSTLSRAAKAERRVRWLERQAKRKDKGG